MKKPKFTEEQIETTAGAASALTGTADAPTSNRVLQEHTSDGCRLTLA
ncbi:hypothetical protein [Stenotrophomonas pigmentata]|nr:hypothetical protein [Stenotrophomonas sp. 610A2]